MIHQYLPQHCRQPQDCRKCAHGITATTREVDVKCDRCNQEIKPGEEREHLGQMLCEDCCMVVLSPMKTCDPWAVHSAKTYEKHAGGNRTLTPIQSKMLKLLKEEGAMEPKQLLAEIDANLTLKDLEREFATLRHMEKARGEKQGDKVLWRIW